MAKVSEEALEAMVSNAVVQAAAAKYVLAVQLAQSAEKDLANMVEDARRTKTNLPEHYWQNAHHARMVANAAEKFLLAVQEATGVKA